MASRLRFPISRSQLKHSQNRINESHKRVTTTTTTTTYAVKEELIQSPSAEPTHDSKISRSSSSSSKLVLVAGGSGGVVASLLNRNIKSRLLVQDPEKAISFFGKQDEETLQVIKGILGTQRILIHLSLRSLLCSIQFYIILFDYIYLNE
ncbi:hypothetical protein CFP56_009648 [Quercus suber]|uniref:Uncharacterized protein n=1 Tax=Quercus suber TaxID=58331 RepID=A0AAW0M5N1_QUESU